jgi:hypothetical protein
VGGFMEIGKILTPVFNAAIIIVIYLIIFYSLRIMYKDMKSGERKKRISRAFGLEVINCGENTDVERGAIIPINREITMGRKSDNQLILNDMYVSGYHVKIYLRNTDYFIEDLGSTNGTFLNDKKLENKEYLNPGDEIQVGSAVFKVIG